MCVCVCLCACVYVCVHAFHDTAYCSSCALVTRQSSHKGGCDMCTCDLQKNTDLSFVVLLTSCIIRVMGHKCMLKVKKCSPVMGL